MWQSAEVTNEYSRLSPAEQVTLLNLWGIFRSPLMMGGYLPENDSLTLALLTNKNLIELNQNGTGNRVTYTDENIAAWTAASGDGKTTWLALFNLADKKQTMGVNLKAEGLKEGTSYGAHDIWTKKQIILAGGKETTLEAHESVLYKIFHD